MAPEDLDADPKHVLTMLQFNALDDWNRGEIAEEVNKRHGTNYSAYDVSDVLIQIAEEARNGDPDDVAFTYATRGVGTALGDSGSTEIRTIFEAAYANSS